MAPAARSFPSTHPSLLAKVQDQQAAAWAAFFERYQTVIFNWCRRKGLPHIDAEELTQTFMAEAPCKLRAYQLVDDDGEPNRFRSWLKTVIERRITDYRRALARHSADHAPGWEAHCEQIEAVLATESIREVADELLDAFTHEVESVVAAVRDRVHPDTWTAFERCELLDESPAEVAHALGKTVGAVLVAVHRVNTQLAASGVLLAQKPSTPDRLKVPHGSLPQRRRTPQVPDG